MTKCSSKACYINYLKLRPPLATVGPPDQTEQHVTSGQCAEASGLRALPSHDGKGSISAANGGGRIHVTFFKNTWSFAPDLARPNLARRPKRLSKLVWYLLPHSLPVHHLGRGSLCRQIKSYSSKDLKCVVVVIVIRS